VRVRAAVIGAASVPAAAAESPSKGRGDGPGLRVSGSDDASPRGPVSETGPWSVAKGVFGRILHEQLTDSAAALAYYFVLALVPITVVLVGVVGLVMSSPESAFNQFAKLFQLDRSSEFANASHQLFMIVGRTSGRAGTAVIFGAIVALWSFSGAMQSFIRAVNRAFGLEETRNWLVTRSLGLALALFTAIVWTISLSAIVLAGGLADRLVKRFGFADVWRTIFTYAPYVVLFVVLVLYLACLYTVAPDRRPRHVGWVSIGALTGAVTWVLAAVGLAVYVNQVGTYGKIYGPLSAVVVGILFLWLSGLAILIGAAVDAELESRRR
jgi:membrane protein